jgi:hypothetical protein
MREKQRTERENQALIAAGFESTGEEDDLWSKDGVWFGGNAALQSARRTLRASTGREIFDRVSQKPARGQEDPRLEDGVQP